MWVCYQSEGSQQAREKGRREPYGVQQREMPSSAPGEENPMPQYRLGADQRETAWPSMSQQRRPCSKESNSLPGCPGNGVASRPREVIFPFY